MIYRDRLISLICDMRQPHHTMRTKYNELGNFTDSLPTRTLPDCVSTALLLILVWTISFLPSVTCLHHKPAFSQRTPVARDVLPPYLWRVRILVLLVPACHGKSGEHHYRRYQW